MPEASSIAQSQLTLSVIVPTFREAENIPVLFERLKAKLASLPWEMIVVDDNSPDGTYDVAFALAKADPRLRCLRRVKRNGLSGAVIEGCLSSSADLVAVIDGDLQHDESIIPAMHRALSDNLGNIAIGTRVADATIPAGLSPLRQKLSDLGAWFFRRAAGVVVKDPMSGFFMLRRDIIARLAPRLSPDGFKILVDIILSEGAALRVVETPYVFKQRQAGESKLSILVGFDFLGLMAHHISGGVLPIRFVLFALIGGFGLVVQLFALRLLLNAGGPQAFPIAQFIATLAAICSNFILNNEITYRAIRYRGFRKFLGLALFGVLCGVGALANVGVASWLYRNDSVWWAAGVAGAMVSVVWNYAVSTSFVWRRRR